MNSPSSQPMAVDWTAIKLCETPHQAPTKHPKQEGCSYSNRHSLHSPPCPCRPDCRIQPGNKLCPCPAKQPAKYCLVIPLLLNHNLLTAMAGAQRAEFLTYQGVLCPQGRSWGPAGAVLTGAHPDRAFHTQQSPSAAPFGSHGGGTCPDLGT